jgi:hypothetical protein
MAKKIVVDPFFDGGAAPPTDGEAGYAPVEDTELARMLPPGPSGLRGTVVPKAASDNFGATTGWHDADPIRTEIHVDPDIPGQSTVVRLSDMNPERVAAALEETKGVDPRIRISAVYNALANGPAEPAVQEQGASRREATVGPLTVFNSSKVESSHNEVAQTPDKMQTMAPTKWVTFEIDGFGEHRAPYHRVIHSNSTLVLVYDTSCDGAQRFFPRTTDQPLGIHIEGESVAYYAHTTGIEFSDAGVDYCVLLVEREAPLPADSDDME